MRAAPPAGGVFSPLDEELGLLPGTLSPSLVESAVRLGTWLPFEPAAQMLAHFTRTDISKPTVRRLTEEAGAAYVAVQAAQVEALEQTLPEAPAGPPRLQVSVDGAMVPLVGGEWAEVKTLALGAVAAPELNQKRGEREVHTQELSYFSRLADHETFARLATVETHRRGVESAGVVCGVVDGADWCQQFLDLHRPDAVRILDFPHALQHLAGAAQATFGPGTAETSTWLGEQAHTLKHGDSEQVLAALRGLPVQQATDPGAAAQVRDQTLSYLEKRREQIRYADFQAQGYPIGSGCVESANKLVVEARLKGAGMHWAREHVNPLVALRTIACSDRWEESWPLIGAELRARTRPGLAAQPPVLATPPPRAQSPSRQPLVEPLRRLPPSPTPIIVNGRPTAEHPWKKRPLLAGGRAAAASHAKS